MLELVLLCNASIAIVTTPVGQMPQVTVTLICGVIRTNCQCIVGKELRTNIHLHTSYISIYRKSGIFHVEIIHVVNIHVDLFSWVAL